MASDSFEWAAKSGDAWARRWREIDRALAPVGAALHEAVLGIAPEIPFSALDIGCGAGASSIALGNARPDARILGCDLSQALVAIAGQRAAALDQVCFQVEDAVTAASRCGPLDLFLSRHGVMFFPDPRAAFATFRQAASDGAAMIFSCFRSWDDNAWASELAQAAAGKPLDPPGREPSGFAFAEPDYVRRLLEDGGWAAGDPKPVDFAYVSAEGGEAVDDALSLLSEVGPASAVLRGLPQDQAPAARERMRTVVERYRDGERVAFPAAAWIWSARARA